MILSQAHFRGSKVFIEAGISKLSISYTLQVTEVCMETSVCDAPSVLRLHKTSLWDQWKRQPIFPDVTQLHFMITRKDYLMITRNPNNHKGTVLSLKPPPLKQRLKKKTPQQFDFSTTARQVGLSIFETDQDMAWSPVQPSSMGCLQDAKFMQLYSSKKKKKKRLRKVVLLPQQPQAFPRPLCINVFKVTTYLARLLFLQIRTVSCVY